MNRFSYVRGLGRTESQKAQADGRAGREGGEVPVILFPLPWEPVHKCLSRLQLTLYYFFLMQGKCHF